MLLIKLNLKFSASRIQLSDIWGIMATKPEMCQSQIQLSTDIGNWQRQVDPGYTAFEIADSRREIEVTRHASPTQPTTEIVAKLPDGAVIAKVSLPNH